MFEKWVEDVSENLKALSGGKTFHRLSAAPTLQVWFDSGMTAEAAAQEWFNRAEAAAASRVAAASAAAWAQE